MMECEPLVPKISLRPSPFMSATATSEFHMPPPKPGSPSRRAGQPARTVPLDENTVTWRDPIPSARPSLTRSGTAGEEYQAFMQSGPGSQPPYFHISTGALTPGDCARNSLPLNQSANRAKATTVNLGSTTILRRLMPASKVVIYSTCSSGSLILIAEIQRHVPERLLVRALTGHGVSPRRAAV